MAEIFTMLTFQVLGHVLQLSLILIIFMLEILF